MRLRSAEEIPANPFSSYSARAYAYAADVLTGKVLAGKWVRLAAQRFLNDIERDRQGWKYTFDERVANATCALFELFPHEKGPLFKQQVRLANWQCFIFCNVFGWLDRATRHRRFIESFVLIPKGNGKTPMGAWVTLKLGFFDGEKGAEVYCAASSAEQANEVFKVAKFIVEETSSLTQRMGIVPSPFSLYQRRTNSRVRVISGRYKDGKSPSGAINDEYHQQPDDTLRDSLRNAMDKRPQTLMFDISTAGDTMEGPCRRKQDDVEAILSRVYENERQFGIIYDVDKEVDWRTREACVMANPNFGVSMDEEKTLASLAEAIRNPAKQNDFRCKRQDCWVQQTHAWMNQASWKDCEKPGITEDQFLEYPCFHASDLASTIDLSATLKLFVRFREDGKRVYTAFLKAYLPKKRALDPSKQHYQDWVHRGLLIATEGAAIDYKRIEDDTVKDVERFKVQELCYDRRYAAPYAQQVQARTGITITEIVPSPDQFSPAMKELEAAVEDQRFEHDGNPILTWCVANIQARMNQATGNYHLPTKDQGEKKIDGGVALLIAIARARFCTGHQFISSDLEII